MLSSSDPQSHHSHNHNHNHHHHHLHNHDHNNHLDLPNFSIRDYVFTARSKDIKTNWPFSLKNLHLCLKHGVKDILPPFQALDALRTTQLCTSCSVDCPLLDNGNFASNTDHNHAISLHNDACQVLKADFNASTTTNSCRSGETVNLLPSTTTSVSESPEIQESLPTTNKSSSSLETSSVDPPNPVHKPQTTSRRGKCKLIVKFGSNSDRSSAEDIASNSTTQSEAMASKICPVCKTFSSSSNTTLNAHIDQCLSVESSTPKWTVDSKLTSTRHRVKPRKTRLMVDIYTTALPCTLEDLDRRNGSNWASGASKCPMSDDKSETPEEDKEQPESPVPLDDHADVGAVYIDSNGIKLRILSKSEDTSQVSKVIEHLRPRKPLKGTKFLSARKKKRRASKFSHYFKLAQTKKLLSKNPHTSQASEGEVKKSDDRVSHEVRGRDIQKHVMNSGNSGNLRQWACSKRTGVAKKFNNKVRHKRSWNISSQDLRNIRHNSSFGQNDEEELVADLSENQVHEAQDNLLVERSPGLNKAVRSLTPIKRKARQLIRKERLSKDDDDDDDYRMKGSSVRKDMLSSIRTSVTEPRSDVANKSLGLKRSNVMRSRMDEEIVPWDSEPFRPYEPEHSFAVNHQSGTEDMDQQDSPMGLPFQYHPQGHLVENADSRLMGIDDEDEDDDYDDDDEHREYPCSIDGINNVSQLSSEVAVRGKSVDSEMNKLGTHSKIPSNSLQYKGSLCDDVQVLPGSSRPSCFVGEQEMFYGVHQLGNVNNMGAEDLNSDIAQGISFPHVDPIPIPGPPGSFLPSPRDMGSEDFQGNSSLTTSRVQSSQEQHDFIDGDSSDSPVSATSTISNFTASRYDLKHSEPLPSAVSHPGQVNMRSSFSGCSIDSSIDSTALAGRSTGPFMPAEKFKAVNKIPLGFKTTDNNEPCCCQRKERVTSLDHVVLNSQESLLFKRRAMANSSNFPDVPVTCSRQTLINNAVEASSGQMFSPPAIGSEKAVPRAPLGLSSWRGGPADAGAKFPIRNDCDSMSPSSSSNSILRLMGKNLMVVNRDQDEYSMPAWQPQQQSTINSQIPVFSGANGIQQPQPSQVTYNSFNPNFHNSRAQTMVYQGPGYAFPKQHTDGGFAMPPHEYNPTPPTWQRRPSSSRNRPMIGSPIEQRRNQEIITIDDSPETETDHLNYSTHFYGSHSENAGFERKANAGPVMGWSNSCTGDGSGVSQQSQFMATQAAPSSRSGMYKCQSSLL